MLAAPVIVTKFSIIDHTDGQADVRRRHSVYQQVGDTPGPALGLLHKFDAVFTGDLSTCRDGKTVSGIKSVI